MNTAAVKCYKSTHVLTTDPYKLILLLYDEAIKQLFKTREAIKNNDIKERGESLSKAIDIITELLASVQGDNNDETVVFLRWLYSNMLTELPKVNITNDLSTIERTIKYIAQLRTIWEKVTKENNYIKQENKPLNKGIKNQKDNNLTYDIKSSNKINYYQTSKFSTRG